MIIFSSIVCGAVATVILYLAYATVIFGVGTVYNVSPGFAKVFNGLSANHKWLERALFGSWLDYMWNVFAVTVIISVVVFAVIG